MNRDADPQPWDVESSRYLSRKAWMTLRQHRVRLPNGIVTEGGLIVLVRQYRHGIRAVH